MKFVKPPDSPTGNFLLCGPPKTGKTIGAGSAPPGVLYVNCDLPSATWELHDRHPNGEILEVEMPEEGKAGMVPLMTEIATEVIKPDQDIVRTVVVDPIGEFYRRLLEDQSNRAIRPSLNAYGDTGALMLRWVRGLCKAPVNVVIVAHEWGYEKAGDEGMTTGIWTGTKSNSVSIGQQIMGMVDVIGYTGVMEQEDGAVRYVAQLRSGKGRQAGDRFNCLIPPGEAPFRDLDLSRWLEEIAIKKAITRATIEKPKAKAA